MAGVLAADAVAVPVEAGVTLPVDSESCVPGCIGWILPPLSPSSISIAAAPASGAALLMLLAIGGGDGPVYGGEAAAIGLVRSTTSSVPPVDGAAAAGRWLFDPAIQSAMVVDGAEPVAVALLRAAD